MIAYSIAELQTTSRRKIPSGRHLAVDDNGRHRLLYDDHFSSFRHRGSSRQTQLAWVSLQYWLGLDGDGDLLLESGYLMEARFTERGESTVNKPRQREA